MNSEGTVGRLRNDVVARTIGCLVGYNARERHIVRSLFGAAARCHDAFKREPLHARGKTGEHLLLTGIVPVGTHSRKSNRCRCDGSFHTVHGNVVVRLVTFHHVVNGIGSGIGSSGHCCVVLAILLQAVLHGTDRHGSSSYQFLRFACVDKTLHWRRDSILGVRVPVCALAGLRVGRAVPHHYKRTEPVNSELNLLVAHIAGKRLNLVAKVNNAGFLARHQALARQFDAHVNVTRGLELITRHGIDERYVEHLREGSVGSLHPKLPRALCEVLYIIHVVLRNLPHAQFSTLRNSRGVAIGHRNVICRTVGRPKLLASLSHDDCLGLGFICSLFFSLG